MREIHLKQFMNKGLLEAGCDEAGRGPLAGPVFAASVILPEDFHHPLLNDSKKMSLKSRETLRPIIEKEAISYAVEAVSSYEIDTINILNASIAGMWRCLMRLYKKPEFILIDGNRFKAYNSIANIKETDKGFIRTFLEGNYNSIPFQTVVHGDATYASIAAASVLAKTARDEYMRKIASWLLPP